MNLLVAMAIRLRAALMTASAVILVLSGAYVLGGRTAKRAVELREKRDENKRLTQTLEVGHNNEIKINRKSADSVHSELESEWMRD